MQLNLPPRVELGYFPTPVARLGRLESLLGGPRIFIKRDDLSGLALGGNKTRKLEFILADALAQGCDTVVTAGAAQSNHCRQTAAAAARLGLECHLVLGGTSPVQAGGNLLLDELLGAHIHWAGEHRKGEDIPALCAQLRAEGKKPCAVPYGGSNELGACAFVGALQELEDQLDTRQLSHIIFASSSGGTHAGLMFGKAALGRDYAITGINIDKDESGALTFDRAIVELANRSSRFLGVGIEFGAADLELNSSYVGAGYGVVGELEREAISLLARHEGILLDPVYSGRAMGAMIDLIRRGLLTREDRVLFWHTGGTPALFAYAEYL